MSSSAKSAPANSLWSRLWRFRNEALARWLLVGLVFMGVTSLFLFWAVDIAGLSVAVGSLVAAEMATLLRYWVNEYWVFRTRSPSWLKLGQFHVANASATAIWWIATNLLDRLGLHHLLAAILAVGLSTGISLVCNFRWIWRRKVPLADAPTR